MKQFLYLALLLPGFIFTQAYNAPTWEYSVVSDLPFHTPMNNEFKAAAEELMAKKWTQQILTILLENTHQQTAFQDKMLFDLALIQIYFSYELYTKYIFFNSPFYWHRIFCHERS